MRISRTLPPLALVGAVLLTTLAQEGPYSPYRQKLPDGEVSWYEGWIRTRAEVPLSQGVPRAQAQVDARRVALMKAQAAALRLALKVPVDADRRLEEFEALKVRVQGVVRGGQILQEGLKGNQYELSLEVPIAGVKGLAAETYPVVMPELASPPPPPKAPPQASAGTPPTRPPVSTPPPQASATPPPAAPKPHSLSTFASVRVEAADAGAKPALYPKIVDPQGQPVYTAATVKPEVARTQTIARYVSRKDELGSDTPSTPSWIGPSSLPLALVDPQKFLLAQQVPPPPPPPAPSSPPVMMEKSMAPDLEFGEEVLVVKAVSAQGKLKADLVVTEKDAQRLRENKALLEKAQVTVVVRTDVGGVESRRAQHGGELLYGRR